MLRILIAAREAVRRSLRENLQGGHEILEAADQPEAIALALRHKPDCILVDLGLPSFGGFELCEAISLFGATRLIPVFALTQRPVAEYRNSFWSPGAADYLQLPLDIEELKKRLVRLLRSKPEERRREPRVRSNSILKLVGSDARGNLFELATMVDDISVGGFLCACNRELKKDAVVRVFLMGKDQPYIGQARVVHTQWRNTAWQRCAFEFLQKPQHWLEEQSKTR